MTKMTLFLEAVFKILVQDLVDNNLIPEWNIDAANERAQQLARQLGEQDAIAEADWIEPSRADA